MIRIALSIEGQTEDEFCKKVLTPFFRYYDIEMIPVIVSTSKDKCGRKHKGGCINVNRIKSEIQKLLSNHDYVTTLYDFYGFSDRPTDDIDELEKILYELFNDRKFIPYIQKYEFETLLFSKPEYFTEYFGDDNVEKEMRKMIDVVADIEKINDSPETAPHKRLESLFELMNEKYDKVFHGEGIAGDIGLAAMREESIRFNGWIEKILKLA
ncbi:MAG TPA: hypothetical protein CFH82_08130 [Sulfurospirillum sp. UBA12182]|jgi:hypothetical protein|nr:MAG TPA: hypothetical protein CFH82_08130 [Sulfurospirillum sp. UBA12182]